MDARSINAAHASMSKKSLVQRLREHGSLTEIEAAVEIERLRSVVRINGLRWGHTHEEIDKILAV